MKSIIILALLIICLDIKASETGTVTGLELPRYVSLKSDDANIRVGPSKNYPINLKYIIKNFPLLIIDEYKDWRKVSDFQNNTGWIHRSLITGQRYGLIISKDDEKINILNSENGIIIGEIFIDNLVEIRKCKINTCYIAVENESGWVSKKNIWGVKDNEVYNIGYFQSFIDIYWHSINYLRKILKI